MMDDEIYDHIIFLADPDLNEPVLVVALEGWIDAGLGASNAIGTMLEVGASVTKNHRPRKPHFGWRISATIVSIRRKTTSSAYGSTSPSRRGSSQP